MKTIALIGCGNMGRGMLCALCANPEIQKSDIIITEQNPDRLAAITQEFGCLGTANNHEAVMQADYIFLCVKPQVLPSVLEALRPVLKDCISQGQKKVLVSIAAGTTIASIQDWSGLTPEMLPVVRILPNLPASIGEGLLFFATSHPDADIHCDALMALLKKAGILRKIPESQMDIAGVIGGCVPAFAYMFIESMADGAVLCGMPRADAILYAAQAVKGAAGLVLEGTKHPEQLKDEVCSPAGTTITGVKALEEHGFRNAASSAVIAACEKSVSLSRKS